MKHTATPEQLAEALARVNGSGLQQQTPKDSGTALSDWWRQSITAAQLQKMEFPPLRFAVPGLIPEGLTLLAGKPKIGKSWLTLDLAIAIAAGRFTLGTSKPDEGDVLYLALEDGKRRLQRRFTKLLPTFVGTWPERLTILTEWRRVDDGGIEGVAAWASSVSKPTFVVVDTMEKIRPAPPASGKVSAYSLDYRALDGLQKLAGEKALAIMVTTHVRKADADDVFDTISGTLGLTAAVDTIAVLGQRNGSPALCIRGRDIEEVENAMLFNRETCRWSIIGPAADVARSDTRGKILTALVEASDSMSPHDLKVATGLSRQNIDQTLLRMAKDAEIVKISRGHYVHPDRHDLISSKNVSEVSDVRSGDKRF